MAPEDDRSQQPALPPITLRKSDAERLYGIAMDALLTNPRCAGGLLDELQRAFIVADDEASPDVAGIGSYVDFVDARVRPERIQRGQLVCPAEAVGRDKISVLSDFGAALLGLSAGQSIVWPDRRGGAERLTVLAVYTRLQPNGGAERL